MQYVNFISMHTKHYPGICFREITLMPGTKKKTSCKSFDLQDFVAEREGFEPPEV